MPSEKAMQLPAVGYGVDVGAEGGDKTALSIYYDEKAFCYTGEEAEAILAMCERNTAEAIATLTKQRDMAVEALRL